jgi:hypothetical protein
METDEMNAHRVFSLCIVAVFVLLVSACAGSDAPPTAVAEETAAANLTQTAAAETAIAQKVEATLAARDTALPETSTVASDRATDTPDAAPTDTPSTPTDTPLAPANTPPAPTDTPPQSEQPTATLILLTIAESDVDGDDGNDFVRGSSESNNGRVILLPEFKETDVTDPVVFRDKIAFQIEVFDTRAGLTDGAGIRDVTFHIEAEDGSGQVVFENQADQPSYCAFGSDESGCAFLDIVGSGGRWPGTYGRGIYNTRYMARIDIVTEAGDVTQWRWRFIVENPSLPELPPPNTALIKHIDVQDGVYVVDFETFGFEPLLESGRTHLHFFFNTVPPEQAGVPGSGPWQIYPTGPGQPNTTPFTLYAAADRPEAATQMCVLVANHDHSVNMNTGNCVDLPAP